MTRRNKFMERYWWDLHINSVRFGSLVGTITRV
jgi:hypothetical protein